MTRDVESEMPHQGHEYSNIISGPWAYLGLASRNSAYELENQSALKLTSLCAI